MLDWLRYKTGRWMDLGMEGNKGIDSERNKVLRRHSG